MNSTFPVAGGVYSPRGSRHPWYLRFGSGPIYVVLDMNLDDLDEWLALARGEKTRSIIAGGRVYAAVDREFGFALEYYGDRECNRVTFVRVPTAQVLPQLLRELEQVHALLRPKPLSSVTNR